MSDAPVPGKGPPGLLTLEIAAILRAQIARNKINQAPLAKAAHMSQPQLSGILNGRKHLDVEQLDRLCSAVGLELRKVITEADGATTQRHII